VHTLVEYAEFSAEGHAFPRNHDPDMGTRLLPHYGALGPAKVNSIAVGRTFLAMHPERKDEAHERPISKERYMAWATKTLREQLVPEALVLLRAERMWALVRGRSTWDGQQMTLMFAHTR
jgi:hypothetical protein